MSFLNPKQFQDASRVLRGLALVAAKAAADSPLWRQAGRTDYRAALEQALRDASKQSAHVAENLQRAARQGRQDTAQGVERGLQGGKQAADAVTQQLQGVLKDGERLLNSVLKDGERLFNETAQGSGPVQQSLQQRRGAAADGATAARQHAPAGEAATAEALQTAAVGLREAAEVGSTTPHRALVFSAERGQAVLRTTAPGVPGSPAVPPPPTSTALNQWETPPLAAAPVVAEAPLSDASGSVHWGEAPPPAAGVADSPVVPPAPSTVIHQWEAPSSAAALGVTEPSPLSNASGSMHQREAPPAAAAAPVVAEAPPLNDASGGMHQPVAPPAAQAAANPSAGPSAVEEPILAAEPVGAPAAQAGGPLTAAGARSALSGGRERPERQGVEELQAAQHLAEASKEESLTRQKSEVRRKLRERRVPSSPIGRVFGFAQLGASLVYGTMSDSVSQYFRGGGEGAAGAPKANNTGNKYLTEANAERLADALCRMRGAALKLGQMLSIQDENVIPPQLTAALERVRAGADIMPRRQLEKVLVAELGPEWRARLADFEYDPLAAASIGQVHRATLHDGRKVALKIQYPGVARSIESDVDNLLRLISYANILPKGLYVEAAAKVAKRELALECDYAYEARSQAQFRALVRGDPDLRDVVSVPDVIGELCTRHLLTTEWVPGAHIDKVAEMGQEVRDAVGTLLLQLTLKELFQWRFMQTDPNWGNFLYDAHSGVLHLIDFGAAREYPQAFVDDYLRMVRACAEQDRTEVILRSTRMGFLTGDESPVMLDAHAEAGYAVGTPFASPGAYDFAQHGPLTRRVSDLGAVMLRHRLTAPPEEAYSLHRKLAGAYLACIKLRARVPCRDLFLDVFERHQFGGAPSPGGGGAAEQQAVAA